MDIEYKIMQSTPENALYVERMRYKAYGVQKLIDPTEEDFMEDIIDGSFLVFLCLIEGKPASACYVSNFNASLYVEYLFTLPVGNAFAFEPLNITSPSSVFKLLFGSSA